MVFRSVLYNATLCMAHPQAYQLGGERGAVRLLSLPRPVVSTVIRDLKHGALDYEWLDVMLGRSHTYEEGAAFIQGLYICWDEARDAAMAREE
jgi:hypothetical protein